MPCGVLESESHVSSRDLKRKLKKKGSTPSIILQINTMTSSLLLPFQYTIEKEKERKPVSPRLFDHIEDNIPEDTVLNK
jgi:hypothetical protein